MGYYGAISGKVLNFDRQRGFGFVDGSSHGYGTHLFRIEQGRVPISCIEAGRPDHGDQVFFDQKRRPDRIPQAGDQLLFLTKSSRPPQEGKKPKATVWCFEGEWVQYLRTLPQIRLTVGGVDRLWSVNLLFALNRGYGQDPLPDDATWWVRPSSDVYFPGLRDLDWQGQIDLTATRDEDEGWMQVDDPRPCLGIAC